MKKYQIGIVLALCIVALVFQHATGLRCIITSGESMEPTYSAGDMLLFTKPFTALRSGDVVLIRHQNILMVKRICAVAGQMALVPAVTGEAGQPTPGNHESDGLSVYPRQSNSSAALLPFWTDIYWSPYLNADSIILYHYWSDSIDAAVPEGYVFVAGDNLSASYDSRNPEFGLIPTSQILGRLLSIP